jgi:hypothetical protein
MSAAKPFFADIPVSDGEIDSLRAATRLDQFDGALDPIRIVATLSRQLAGRG